MSTPPDLFNMPTSGHFLDPQQPQHRAPFDKISENVFGSRTLFLYTGSTFLGWKPKVEQQANLVIDSTLSFILFKDKVANVLIKHNTIKTYGDREGRCPRILNLALNVLIKHNTIKTYGDREGRCPRILNLALNVLIKQNTIKTYGDREGRCPRILNLALNERQQQQQDEKHLSL